MNNFPVPKPDHLKNSWKDRYITVLLLMIGIIYLGLWLLSIFSDTASFMHIEQDKLSMSVSELLNHIRTVMTILLSLTGGILINRGRKAGFVAGTPILTLFLVIVSGGLYQAQQLGETSLLIFALPAFCILLTGLLFLWRPASVNRLRITSVTRLLTIGISLLLLLFYFFVQ